MGAIDVVNAILDAFRAGTSRTALFADGFRVEGPGLGAPLLAFAMPGAAAGELDQRGMRISVEQVLPSKGDHVLVWGMWSGGDHDDATYHVVLEVQDGRVVETRFFDELEQARWFAGL